MQRKGAYRMSLIRSFVKKHSIQTTVISFILIFTVLAILLLTNISKYFITEFVMDRYLSDYLQTFYSGFDNSLSTIISRLNMVCMDLATRQELYLKLLSPEISNDEKQRLVSDSLAPLIKNHNIIQGIDIVAGDNVYRYSKAPLDFDAPRDMFPDITRSALTFHKGGLISDGVNYTAVGTKYYNFFNNSDLGYIILYFKEDTLFSIYKSSIIKGSNFFITADDYIISHSDKSLIGSKVYIPYEFYSGKKLSIKRYETDIISKYTMPSNNINSNVCIVAVIAADILYNIVNLINRDLTLMFAFMLTLAVLFAFLFTKRLLQQYTDMRESIEAFGNNPYSVIKFKTANEVRALEESFSKMVRHISRLMEETELANERQRAAELKALQIHINPHFIYNALDIITCMAKFNGEREIEDMTYALASFFRIGLSNGRNIISISEEIKHVQSYIHIEKMRFPDLFDVEYDIPDEIAQNYLIVKIILQPLVENCIKHGFHGIKYKGIIKIAAVMDENDIYITVSDNGSGMSDNSPSSNARYAFGYGLKNVQQRLELEYGEGYGLTFSQSTGHGTTVTVRIKKVHTDAFTESSSVSNTVLKEKSKCTASISTQNTRTSSTEEITTPSNG